MVPAHDTGGPFPATRISAILALRSGRAEDLFVNHDPARTRFRTFLRTCLDRYIQREDARFITAQSSR
ncbi:MAG TPA: hypothetical protein VNN55_06150 [bacterium]|nr:hypothetical protein [bacterium]